MSNDTLALVGAIIFSVSIISFLLICIFHVSFLDVSDGAMTLLVVVFIILLTLGAILTGADSSKPKDQHMNTIQHEKTPEGFGAEYLLLPLLF